MVSVAGQDEQPAPSAAAMTSRSIRPECASRVNGQHSRRAAASSPGGAAGQVARMLFPAWSSTVAAGTGTRRSARPGSAR